MNWRRIWIGLFAGVLLMLMVRWAAFLTPLIIGIVIGFIVRKPLRGLVVGAVAGAVGNIITVLAFPVIGSHTIVAVYGNIVSSNPILFAVLSTLVIAIGGAIGGGISATGLQLTYQKGVKKGEEVERIKTEMKRDTGSKKPGKKTA